MTFAPRNRVKRWAWRNFSDEILDVVMVFGGIITFVLLLALACVLVAALFDGGRGYTGYVFTLIGLSVVSAFLTWIAHR